VATDAQGAIIFESGRPNDDGSIDGNKADFDLSAFEPHYDVIDSPDKVQIYESIAKNTEGAVTYTFLRSAEHMKENRLLPRGLDKSVAPEEIKPHAEALQDPNFVGGSDTVTYVINGDTHQGPVTVKAELLFQSVSFAFVQDLIEHTAQSSYINRFQKFYQMADKTPVVISSAEIRGTF
jgi:hypothetical protein